MQLVVTHLAQQITIMFRGLQNTSPLRKVLLYLKKAMKIPFPLLLIYNTSLFQQVRFDVTTQRVTSVVCLKLNVHVLALQQGSINVQEKKKEHI